MTNAKLTTLLTGALIVAALWFRVFVVVANPTSHVIDSTDDAEVINSDTMPPEEVLVALKNMDVSSKICTTDKGSPVKCSEINEDTICIRVRAGAPSGIRIDCKTDQPIPADEYSGTRARDAKYRSPYYD